MEIKILNKEFYKEYKLPRYATTGSAGLDLRSTSDFTITPGNIFAVRTGIAVHIGSDYWLPDNYVGIITPRSGWGSAGLVLANTLGIIDEDYQGEIVLNMWNRNEDVHLHVHKGDRIAQLIFMPIFKPSFELVEEFNETTVRGFGGFGSTGE